MFVGEQQISRIIILKDADESAEELPSNMTNFGKSIS